MHSQRGFTLLELMITVGILILVIGIGIPSFKGVLESNRATTAANDLVGSLLAARSEAVKRERTVSIVPNPNWNAGWITFEDLNGDGSQDGGDTLLFNHSNDSEGVAITANGGVAAAITYNAVGRTSRPDPLDTSTDYFDMIIGDSARKVCLTLIGRPFVVEKGEDCP